MNAWNKVRQDLSESITPDAAWEALDRYSDTVAQQIDLLVNYTAGAGFTYKQYARRMVAVEMQLNLAGTMLALLLLMLVAWLLAARIIGPLATASAVAERIARGSLDGIIPSGGADELGTLLASMSVMRDNIRVMMEREAAQSRSAQTRLAEALESSREGVVVVDAEGRIALANSQAVEFFGDTVQLGQPVRFITELASVVEENRPGIGVANEARLADG